MTSQQTNLIEQLFSSISNDEEMPSDLKLCLMRLRSPIHKLSMSDSYFYINEHHPARNTLDIARRFSRHVEQDDSLLTQIDNIINELLRSSLNSTAFSVANHRLVSLLQQLDNSHQNASASSLDSRTIRPEVNQRIRTYLEGQEIPDSCKLLTLKLWPSALCHLYKSHGEHSAQWSNALAMYCELIESLQPVENMQHYKYLKDNYMRIARSNNNMLLLYHQESHVETAIKSLIKHYNSQLRDTSFGQANTNMQKISAVDTFNPLPDRRHS